MAVGLQGKARVRTLTANGLNDRTLANNVTVALVGQIHLDMRSSGFHVLHTANAAVTGIQGTGFLAHPQPLKPFLPPLYHHILKRVTKDSLRTIKRDPFKKNGSEIVRVSSLYGALLLKANSVVLDAMRCPRTST